MSSSSNTDTPRAPRADHPRRPPVRAALPLVCALACLGTFHSSAAAGPGYHADIAPILRDYCAGCHNDGDLEGELSVETHASLMKGGENGAPVIPGKSSESLLFQMLTRQNGKKGMPPKNEPQLSPAQIALLEQWIDAGAQGPGPGQDRSLLKTLVVPDIPPASQRGYVTAVAWSPDRQTQAVATQNQVTLTGTAPEKTPGAQASIRTLEHPGKVHSIHFSADSQTLITASGIAGLSGTATLFHKDGTLLRTFEDQHRDTLYDAELSPDGKRLATAGYDGRILIWNSETAGVLLTIDGHNGAVFDLAFSPDGTLLASASADETVKLWRVTDGLRLDTLNQPTAEQLSVLFTHDGKHIIAAGADNRIRLWQLRSTNNPELNPLLHARFGHEGDIVALALSGDGKWLVSASTDRTVKLWTVPGLVQSRVWGDQPDIASALVIPPTGGTVRVHRMDGSQEEWALEPETPKAAIAAVHGSGASPQAAEATAANPAKEREPNDHPAEASPVELPAAAEGVIGTPGDSDLFQFSARAGEQWVVEINAARRKSPLDSVIAVLDSKGNPIEQVVLQAVRDSWFTFRGKDSVASADFRLQNWREMELNEYLYSNGEVVKLWLYPQGPDSGFKVYPGFGERHTFFHTTALTHPLGEPCYIVTPLPPGSQPSPNGLPVFRLNHENDDESQRRWGTDSQLFFTAPADGSYLARVTDVRGAGGTNFTYTLTIRPRRPDFKITLQGANPAVSPGSGREFTAAAERLDGFEGSIQVGVTDLPPGFSVPTPIVIEAGQTRAPGVIYADPNAQAPPPEQNGKSKLTATALINGREVTHDAGTLGEIKLGPPAKLLVEILPDPPATNGEPAAAQTPLELTLAPGETITARVKATRIDFVNRIELGGDDSGRNLPHGVYVDNIGLNGLLIVEGESERQFQITAAPWVPETTRHFYLRATGDGGQASRPALLHIRKTPHQAASNQSTPP